MAETFRILDLRFLFIPFALTWRHVILTGGLSVKWRVVYVFGVRVAQWRIDDP